MKNSKGFTLIELLMCVLIIAVLTAVAAPQYTKAVERSRATEAMNLIKSINDAVYAFAAGRSSGQCPTSFRQLSVSIPTENDNVSAISLKNFQYTLGGAPDAIVPGTRCAGATATRINGGQYDYVIWNPYTVRATAEDHARLGCYSPTDNAASMDLCASLGLNTTSRPGTVSGNNGNSFQPIEEPGVGVEIGDPLTPSTPFEP